MDLRSGSRGQATVEMALVLPVLLWLLVGMVDAARMAQSVLTLQHAAGAGLRLGMTGASDAQIQARVLGQVPSLAPELVTVTVSPTGTRRSGTDLTVTVAYRYRVLALPSLFGAEVNLRSALTSRVE